MILNRMKEKPKMLKTLIVTIQWLALTACGQSPTIPGFEGTDAVPVSTAAPEVASGDPTPTPLALVSTPTPIPTATPVPTPTPSPTPAPTVLNFGFYNSIGICDAVKAWNPVTTEIIFPANGAASDKFNFLPSGIYLQEGASTFPGGLFTGTIVKDGALWHPAQCTITVDHGALVSVL